MEQLFNISYWMWLCGWNAEYTREWFRGFPRKQVSSDTHAEKR
jgi:hypothetical protein